MAKKRDKPPQRRKQHKLHVDPSVVEQPSTGTLAQTAVPVLCRIAVEETFLSGRHYIVISAAPGHTMPELKTGQECLVQFSPSPAQPLPESP